MRLIITRHPITRNNKLGIIQGKEHGDIEEEGFEQLKKLINRLKGCGINRIISSDSKRTKIMTNEILKHIKVPVEFTGLIDEKSYGNYSGKRASEIDPSCLEGDSPETMKYPGGENLKDLEKRAKKFLNEIVEKYGDSDENILIVSHGIFLLIFMGLILNLNLLDSMYKLSLDHCSISIIEINKDNKFKYNLKVLNETSFLS